MTRNEIKLTLIHHAVVTQYDNAILCGLSEEDFDKFEDVAKGIQKMKRSYDRAASKRDYLNRTENTSRKLMAQFRNILYNI